jgi:RimJ/RimL family protein N-acetyltransferase
MAGTLETRMLRLAERDAALSYLGRDALANLFLLDLTARLGSPPWPGEVPTEIASAWRGGEIVGLAGLRPSVVFDAGIEAEALGALLPYLNSLGVGLVKSPAAVVDVLWEHLGPRRHALVDRLETAYCVRAGEARLVARRPNEVVRRVTKADLEPLVVAARESLREEDRPDPFTGDPKGFRRWVQGRLPRARVVESSERIVFVGYADVRRTAGWLLQGVYTWPEVRRWGFATIGVSELCREAFASGADHVQLTVVDGNVAGRRLYERLGFKAFAKLRTILFIPP